MIEFIKGDCLDVASGFDRGHFDLTFCSPPYSAQRNYGMRFRLTGEAWVEWALPRFMECLRVTRGLVAWVIDGPTIDYEWDATPVMLMDRLRKAGVCLRKPPLYVRSGTPGGGGNRKQHADAGGSADWLRNDYEFIVCATAKRGRLPWADTLACGKPPVYGPGGEMSNRLSDGTRVNQWGGKTKLSSSGGRRKDGTIDRRTRPSHVESVIGETRGKRCGGSRREKTGVRKAGGGVMPTIANPGNIIRGAVGGGLMGHKLAHENEAPFTLWLAEFFVRSFCPPGGTVFDPFAGSGTTGHACELHGRSHVGVDIRQGQIWLAEQRIRQVQNEAAYRKESS